MRERSETVGEERVGQSEKRWREQNQKREGDSEGREMREKRDKGDRLRGDVENERE